MSRWVLWVVAPMVRALTAIVALVCFVGAFVVIGMYLPAIVASIR